MANSVNLEFAGDASKLAAAAKKAEQATEGVGKSASSASDDFNAVAKESRGFEQRIGSLGAGVTGMTDALDSAGGALQAVADVQDYARERASRLERAQIDVEQAMADGRQAAIDLEQSFVDLDQAQQDLTQGALDYDQASIDVEQAMLDAATAQKEYNQAVKEHGAGSDEAKQAALDLKQANQDLAQSNADLEQAELDVQQADVDLAQAREDGTQASIDAREAQLNLNDAMHEANPPELQEWADKLNLITPLLTAVVGITSLVTAAQWAWNASLLASPVTWIVLGIAAIVAGIVLLVKHWDTVKKAAGVAWDWIKDKASSAWNYLAQIPGNTMRLFAGIAGFISKPYRMAFNLISDAWNNTVGRLSWSVPTWVPIIGGNHISVPNLPKFHTGGVVPGAPGTEMLAVLQAGETVTPAGRSGSGGVTFVRGDGLVDFLIEAIAGEVARRGGDPGTLGLGGRGVA